jgi:hypothetical protein
METKLSQLHTPDAKEREIRKYSKTESQHLRLRRTKIKLTDFRTVKVIGKGAFGEVQFQFIVCVVKLSIFDHSRCDSCRRWIRAKFMR